MATARLESRRESYAEKTQGTGAPLALLLLLLVSTLARKALSAEYAWSEFYRQILKCNFAAIMFSTLVASQTGLSTKTSAQAAAELSR